MKKFIVGRIERVRDVQIKSTIEELTKDLGEQINEISRSIPESSLQTTRRDERCIRA